MPTNTGASQSTTPPPTGGHPRRLVRLPDRGPLGGVCAGVASYLDIDPTIVRVAAVVLACTGPGLPAYLLAWIFVPADDGTVMAPWPGMHPHHRSERTTQLLGFALIAIALSVLWGDWWSPARGWFVPIGLLAGGAWLLLRRDGDEATPPPPPPPAPWGPATPSPLSVTSVPAPPTDATEPPATDIGDTGADTTGTDTTGTTVTDTAETDATGADSGTTDTGVLFGDGPPLDPPTQVMGLPEPPPREGKPKRRRIVGPIVVGALLLWGGIAFVAGVDVQDGLAVGLCLIGAGFVVGAFIGGSKALILPALLVGAALVVTSIVDIPWQGGIGDKRWEVASVRDLDGSYELGIGQGTLDLRGIDLSADPTRTYATDVNLGIGHLLVIVPRGATLKIDGEVGAGDADILGRHDDGMNVEVHRTIRGDADQGTLALHLHLGLGHIEVREAGSSARSSVDVPDGASTTTPPTPTVPPVPTTPAVPVG